MVQNIPIKSGILRDKIIRNFRANVFIYVELLLKFLGWPQMAYPPIILMDNNILFSGLKRHSKFPTDRCLNYDLKRATIV